MLRTRSARASRRSLISVIASVGLLTMPMIPAQADPVTEHVADSSPTTVDPDATLVVGGSMFDGGYLDFEVSDASTGETLSLPQSASPVTTSGVVSVVGAGVYLGDGSSATLIGQVDGTYDGTGGNKLRIAFTSPFVNPSFEQGSTGWTSVNSRVDLGLSTLAGFTTQDTVNYAARLGDDGTLPSNQDNNTPSSMGTYVSSVSTSDHSDGTSALLLQSSSITTQLGYDVVHGPAAYSSTFEATAGDTLYFDWRAVASGDAYDVFGYLLNVSTGAQTEVLDAVGNSDSAQTNWATAQATVPTSGTYRFVFVAGSFDWSGGRATGAKLYIDNVRVYGSKVSAAVVNALVDSVRYERTAASLSTASADRVVQAYVANVNSSVTSTTNLPIRVVYPQVPPVFTSTPSVTVVNTVGPQTRSTTAGTVVATDRNETPITYSLAGGSVTSTEINSVSYDRVATTAFGLMYLASATGEWAFVPDDAAIDAVVADTSTTVEIAATSGSDPGTQTASANATITLDVQGVPDVPTDVTLDTIGNQSLTVSWASPTFVGGTALSEFQVQVSTDAGSTWSVAATTTPATTSATLTGLSNGTTYDVRVRALNGVGASAGSEVVTAVPHITAPVTAPAIASTTPGDHTVDVVITPPTDDGGSAVTGYYYSIDGGSTWSSTPVGTSFTISGLVNGAEHELVVKASNVVGDSPSSAPSTVQAQTTPYVPVLAAVAAVESVELTYSAPSDDGGSPITRYEYSLDGGSTWSTAGASPYTVGGQAAGVSRDVQMRAVNALGAGTATSTQTVVPYTVPDAPTVTTLVERSERVVVTLGAPAFDGARAVTAYQYSLNGGTTWVTRPDAATSFTITGLTDGQTYALAFRAVNLAGAGDDVAGSATPHQQVPVTPPVITSVVEGDRTLTVTVTPPADDGDSPVLGYQYSLDGGTTWTTGLVDAEFAITGLDNGTAYDLTVRAVNAIGASAATAVVTKTPQTVPYAPSFTTTPGIEQVTVTYSAPADDGGWPITGYEYTLDGGSSWTSAGPSPLVLALPAGDEVAVAVRAVNALGGGSNDAAQLVTPYTTPSAPSVVSALAMNHRVVVTLDPPDSDGGRLVTAYKYSVDGGTTWVTRPDAATSFTISGLTNGVAHPLVFCAVNVAGAGASSPVVTVVPTLAPATSGADAAPEVPELDPGTVTSTVNSSDVVPTVSTSGAVLRIQAAGVVLGIEAFNADGSPREISSGGVVTLIDDGRVQISGTGLEPGSQADVWAFSTPVLVGVATVAADGTLSESFLLPDSLKPGQHTLQINALRADGSSYSAATGIEIVAAPVAAAGSLAATGADSRMLALWALGLVGVGVLPLVASRRRRYGWR